MGSRDQDRFCRGDLLEHFPWRSIPNMGGLRPCYNVHEGGGTRAGKVGWLTQLIWGWEGENPTKPHELLDRSMLHAIPLPILKLQVDRFRALVFIRYRFTFLVVVNCPYDHTLNRHPLYAMTTTILMKTEHRACYQPSVDLVFSCSSACSHSTSCTPYGVVTEMYGGAFWV